MMPLNNFSQSNHPNSGHNALIPPSPQDPAAFNPDDHLINYNERFKNEPSILFRDTAVNQTLSVMISMLKSNALLTGPAGVGKTKIVEDIARKIATDDPSIPKMLKGYTIYELQINSLMSGTSFRGQLEQRLEMILDFAADPNNKVILFIDEIHQIASETIGAMEHIAQAIKPAMARGNMKLIGATTTQEAKNFLKDPALNRRFSPVSVPELTKAQTLEILKLSMGKFYAHYGLTVSDQGLADAIEIADEKKKAGQHRPDNAITLLVRTMSDILISNLAAPIPATAVSRGHLKQTATRLITGSDAKLSVDLNELSHLLSEIHGQDAVLEHIKDAVARRELGIKPLDKPETFLFCGSSGCGKTETAKLLSKALVNSQPIILNMTEYTSPTSINKIIGSPAGYVGSERPGELPFDILESNPYQVILLDEFEKCHKSIQRLFISAFDEGYFRTSKGGLVDFSKAVVIATTNAGQKFSSAIGFNSQSEKTSVADLAVTFDKELLNRFKHILSYNSISEDAYQSVLQAKYANLAARVIKRNRYTSLPATLSDDDCQLISKQTYQQDFGCRPAMAAVSTFIEDFLLKEQQSQTNQVVPTTQI